jgi:hypothetical protein
MPKNSHVQTPHAIRLCDNDEAHSTDYASKMPQEMRVRVPRAEALCKYVPADPKEEAGTYMRFCLLDFYTNATRSDEWCSPFFCI